MRYDISSLPKVFLLLSLYPSLSFSQDKGPLKVIEPDKQVKTANPAALDTEKFELGFFTGFLSAEDFNTNVVGGVSLNYYINPRIFAQFSYGSSKTKRANSEGDRDFNPDRNFRYFGASAGFRLLEGRSFLGKKRKYNSGIYIVGGLEKVDFAGDGNTGAIIGVSYRTVLTDSLTINIDFKDHIANRNFLNDDKLTQNTELLIGINTIF